MPHGFDLSSTPGRVGCSPSTFVRTGNELWLIPTIIATVDLVELDRPSDRE